MIPNECASKDSPWLVCKPCAASGKCSIADQLWQAKIEVLREAAAKALCSDDKHMLLRMADELERDK